MKWLYILFYYDQKMLVLVLFFMKFIEVYFVTWYLDSFEDVLQTFEENNYYYWCINFNIQLLYCFKSFTFLAVCLNLTSLWVTCWRILVLVVLFHHVALVFPGISALWRCFLCYLTHKYFCFIFIVNMAFSIIKCPFSNLMYFGLCSFLIISGW